MSRCYADNEPGDPDVHNGQGDEAEDELPSILEAVLAGLIILAQGWRMACSMWWGRARQ